MVRRPYVWTGRKGGGGKKRETIDRGMEREREKETDNNQTEKRRKTCITPTPSSPRSPTTVFFTRRLVSLEPEPEAAWGSEAKAISLSIRLQTLLTRGIMTAIKPDNG